MARLTSFLTGARVYNPTVSTRELQAGHSLSAAATAPETVQPNVIAWLDKGMHAHRAIVEGLSAAGASLKTHDSGYLHHWEF